MRTRSVIQWAGALGLSVALSGCGVNQFVDRAINQSMNTAADRVGQRMGEAIAGHVLANLGPDMIRAYSIGLFQLLFYHGGYYFDFADYEPGQYTRWEAEGVEQGEWFEKALLRREDDGSEWWRVESRGTDENSEEVVLIMEALFSPEDESGVRQIRRMRALFPEEREAQEIPITEEEAQSWVVRSNRRLTRESIEGMKTGTEAVETPVGTFTAEHLRSGEPGGSSMNWWVVDSGVPGQVVKYSQIHVDREAEDDEDQQVIYDVTLIKYGDDATDSKLGVF